MAAMAVNTKSKIGGHKAKEILYGAEAFNLGAQDTISCGQSPRLGRLGKTGRGKWIVEI